ncbi:SMC-Scp complex subunit ScpB [Ahniella affigens]|uniref:SMC-Scp complex subunit ScpB n=2 Tax=Ahniella affigens TaxID=2021234 RepID=A0A2P1PP36_9GAMM|nr:SMC-Scp complex subunit ScpB [Ahniella affigens]
MSVVQHENEHDVPAVSEPNTAPEPVRAEGESVVNLEAEIEAQDVFSDQPVHAAPAPTELAELKPLLEAILMAAGRPMTVEHLHDLFGEKQSPGKERILEALSALMQDCDGRGVELVEVASGFRYQVRTDTQIWVSRLWTERQTKYSRALLETLALIAYRQPITRAEIESIRGVAVSSYIIKTLEEREWIRVLGHRDVPGRPALFGTTRLFLDYFNLKSLDQLPPLAELRDFESLEPQMPLAGTTLDEPKSDGVAAESEAPADTADVLADADPVLRDDAGIDESADADSVPSEPMAANEYSEQGDDALAEPPFESGDVDAIADSTPDLVVNDDVEHLNEDLSEPTTDVERADLVDPKPEADEQS